MCCIAHEFLQVYSYIIYFNKIYNIYLRNRPLFCNAFDCLSLYSGMFMCNNVTYLITPIITSHKPYAICY